MTHILTGNYKVHRTKLYLPDGRISCRLEFESLKPASVCAVCNGAVYRITGEIDENDTYTKRVIIQDRRGRFLHYGNIDECFVKEDDVILAGQIIGTPTKRRVTFQAFGPLGKTLSPQYLWISATDSRYGQINMDFLCRFFWMVSVWEAVREWKKYW